MWHMVRARVGGCRIGGSPIFCIGSTCTTLKPTLREMHDPPLARHFELSHEHLQQVVDLTCRRMFRLQAILGSAFRRQDDRFTMWYGRCKVIPHAPDWFVMYGLWSQYIDCTQGLEMWYRLVPATVRTMSPLFWLWDPRIWLVDWTLFCDEWDQDRG